MRYARSWFNLPWLSKMVSAKNLIVVGRMRTQVSVELKTCLVALLATAALGASVVGDRLGGEGNTPIVLSVRDSTAGNLRCSIILAHFVTQNPMPTGEGFELTFEREQPNGALSERTSGSAMLVENILCGDKNAWQNTMSDIPLVLLRSSQSNYFVAHCRIESRLHCGVRAEGL